MSCAGEAVTVNSRLLPVKFTYFFFLAGVASLMPYIPLYMQMVGLSASETAITCAVVSIITAFSRTLIAGLADKMNAHKVVLMLVCLLTAVLHGCMLFVPQRTTPETGRWPIDVQVRCGTNGAYVFARGERVAVALEASVNVSSKTESESYRSDGARLLSFNATDCRWTCRVRQQQNNTQQTKQICFARSHHKKCTMLEHTATFMFRLNTLQLRPMEDCGMLGSSIPDDGNCRCYTLRSFVVGRDTFDQMVCQNHTVLSCSTDYEGTGLRPFGDYIVQNESRWSPVTERTGFHFGMIFWGIAIFYLLGQLTFQPVFGLVDAVAFTFLGEERHLWGKQRLWGTIGFAMFGLLSGILMDAYGQGKDKFAIAFLLFATFMTLSSVSVCQYNIRGLYVTSSTQVFRDVLGLILRPQAFVLFCVVLIFGVYNGLIVTFLFWYLKLLGDVPQVLFGMCIVLNCVLEIGMLFFSGAILKKIGHVSCMLIVFVAYAMRMAGYSFLRNPWMVLCIEPLHCVTYGLMYATASTYASRITPPGTHGSVQSIIGALHFSFGKCLGALLGGPLIETYGGPATFRMFSASALIFIVPYVVAQKFWIKTGETTIVTEMENKKEQEGMDTGDGEETHRMMVVQDGDTPKKAYIANEAGGD